MPVIFSNRLLYRKQLMLKIVRSENEYSDEKNLAISFAVSVQKYLPLPSIEGNGIIYFAQHYAGLMSSVLSEINEHTPFDWRLASEYTKKIWMTKYNLLCAKDYMFPLGYVKKLSSSDLSFFDIIFGISDQFSPEEISYLKLNINDIYKHLAGMAEYLKDYFDEINAGGKLLNGN